MCWAAGGASFAVVLRTGLPDVGLRNRHFAPARARCEGNVVGAMPDFGLAPAQLLRLHRVLVFTRTFNTKAVALQGTGRLGTYASSLG